MEEHKSPNTSSSSKKEKSMPLWTTVAIGILVGNLIFLGIVTLVFMHTDFEQRLFKPIGLAVAEGIEPVLNESLLRASKTATANAQVAAYETVDNIKSQAIEGTTQRIFKAAQSTRQDIANDFQEAASSYLSEYM